MVDESDSHLSEAPAFAEPESAPPVNRRELIALLFYVCAFVFILLAGMTSSWILLAPAAAALIVSEIMRSSGYPILDLFLGTVVAFVLLALLLGVSALTCYR